MKPDVLLTCIHLCHPVHGSCHADGVKVLPTLHDDIEDVLQNGVDKLGPHSSCNRDASQVTYAKACFDDAVVAECKPSVFTDDFRDYHSSRWLTWAVRAVEMRLLMAMYTGTWQEDGYLTSNTYVVPKAKCRTHTAAPALPDDQVYVCTPGGEGSRL
jgi:hypothetical protein